MDKMVEIARFQYAAEARTLISLLESEGIDCYIRDEISSGMLAGYLGGSVQARVETLESNVPRAMEIMEVGGYDLPDEDAYGEEIKTVAGWAGHIPFLRKFPVEKQILILCALIAVLISLLFLGSSFLSGQ